MNTVTLHGYLLALAVPGTLRMATARHTAYQILIDDNKLLDRVDLYEFGNEELATEAIIQSAEMWFKRINGLMCDQQWRMDQAICNSTTPFSDIYTDVQDPTGAIPKCLLELDTTRLREWVGDLGETHLDEVTAMSRDLVTGAVQAYLQRPEREVMRIVRGRDNITAVTAESFTESDNDEVVLKYRAELVASYDNIVKTVDRAIEAEHRLGAADTYDRELVSTILQEIQHTVKQFDDQVGRHVAAMIELGNYLDARDERADAEVVEDLNVAFAAQAYEAESDVPAVAVALEAGDERGVVKRIWDWIVEKIKAFGKWLKGIWDKFTGLFTKKSNNLEKRIDAAEKKVKEKEQESGEPVVIKVESDPKVVAETKKEVAVVKQATVNAKSVDSAAKKKIDASVIAKTEVERKATEAKVAAELAKENERKAEESIKAAADKALAEEVKKRKEAETLAAYQERLDSYNAVSNVLKKAVDVTAIEKLVDGGFGETNFLNLDNVKDPQKVPADMYELALTTYTVGGMLRDAGVKLAEFAKKNPEVWDSYIRGRDEFGSLFERGANEDYAAVVCRLFSTLYLSGENHDLALIDVLNNFRALCKELDLNPERVSIAKFIEVLNKTRAGNAIIVSKETVHTRVMLDVAKPTMSLMNKAINMLTTLTSGASSVDLTVGPLDIPKYLNDNGVEVLFDFTSNETISDAIEVIAGPDLLDGRVEDLINGKSDQSKLTVSSIVSDATSVLQDIQVDQAQLAAIGDMVSKRSTTMINPEDYTVDEITNHQKNMVEIMRAHGMLVRYLMDMHTDLADAINGIVSEIEAAL